ELGKRLLGGRRGQYVEGAASGDLRVSIRDGAGAGESAQRPLLELERNGRQQAGAIQISGKRRQPAQFRVLDLDAGLGYLHLRDSHLPVAGYRQGDSAIERENFGPRRRLLREAGAG